MRKCAHSHETDVLIEVKTILLFATTAADETMIAISAVVDCDYANMNAVLCTTVNENKSRNGHDSFVPGVFKVMPSPLLCFGWMLVPLLLFRVTKFLAF